MNQDLAMGAHNQQQLDGPVAVGACRCQSDRCSSQQQSDTEQRRAELAAVQLAESRVSDSVEALVTAQRLATVRTRMTNASYSPQLVQYFGCFFVADVAVAVTTNGMGCSAVAVLAAVQQGRQQHRCSSYQSRVVVGGKQSQISIEQQEMVQRQSDVSVGCNAKAYSLLRGSVDFSSIECALSLRFCSEAKTCIFRYLKIVWENSSQRWFN